MRGRWRRLTPRPLPGPAPWEESELPALRQRLMRQARLAVHDSAHAEDLVQDTLIAVAQQAATYRGDSGTVDLGDLDPAPQGRRLVPLAGGPPRNADARR
jgi:Sigma-70 region 2